MEIEWHELKLFAADLERAAPLLPPKIAKVTGMAMNNIKKDVRSRWRGMPHLPHLPYSVNYDVKTRGSVVTGEVGADHGKPQGKLAWVAEYGTPTSAPRPAFKPAGDKEIPVWLSFIEQAAVDAIGEYE